MNSSERDALADNIRSLEGSSFEIAEDCYCESDTREMLFSQPGWPVKSLKKGDIVTLIKFWGNQGHSYCRVMKDNTYYDIYPKYLKQIV